MCVCVCVCVYTTAFISDKQPTTELYSVNQIPDLFMINTGKKVTVNSSYRDDCQ